MNNLKNNELICTKNNLNINNGCHVNNETINYSKLSDININLLKKKILNDLIDENINIQIKIANINYYNYLFNYEKYIYNISAGGLFDEWNFY